MHQALNAVNGVQKLFIFLYCFMYCQILKYIKCLQYFERVSFKNFENKRCKKYFYYERYGSCASCLIAVNITQSTFAHTG